MEAAGIDWGAALETMAAGASIVWNSLTLGVKTLVLVFAEAMSAINQVLDFTFGWMTDRFSNNQVELDAWTQKLRSAVVQDYDEVNAGLDTLARNFFNLGDGVDSASASLEGTGAAAKGTADGLKSAHEESDGLARALDGLPDEKNIEVSANRIEEVRQHIQEMGLDLAKIPEEWIIKLAATGNVGEYIEVWDQMLKSLPAEVDVEVVPGVDEPALETTKQKLDTIPPKKEVVVDPMLSI
jgi:hypothetical protein